MEEEERETNVMHVLVQVQKVASTAYVKVFFDPHALCEGIQMLFTT